MKLEPKTRENAFKTRNVKLNESCLLESRWGNLLAFSLVSDGTNTVSKKISFKSKHAKLIFLIKAFSGENVNLFYFFSRKYTENV
jgi:hypothetical protein